MNDTNAAAAPGTWLGDIPRDVTFEIIQYLNLAIGGLGCIRDDIIIGVGPDGERKPENAARSDRTRDTATKAVNDLDSIVRAVNLAREQIATAADLGHTV